MVAATHVSVHETNEEPREGDGHTMGEALKPSLLARVSGSAVRERSRTGRVAGRLRERCRMAGAALLCALGSVAVAQVVTDGTVGPAVSLQGPAYQVTPALGSQVGSNLFHSFDRFSVGTGESVSFSGPQSIGRIVSRVTGGELSNLDGAVSSEIVGADLYLLNPAGIAFGPNASLDLSGAFYASTADYLRFADGATFSARAPATSVLTVAAPSAFGFLETAPAPISVAGSTLFSLGQDMALIGGDLTVSGGVVNMLDGTLRLVGGAPDSEISIADPDPSTASLANGGRVDVSRAALLSARRIEIRARSLELNGSRINAFSATPGAEVTVDIELGESATIAASGVLAGVVPGQVDGQIRIAAPGVTVTAGSSIATAIVGPADGGADADLGLVRVTSRDLVVDQGASIASTGTLADAGDIVISTDRLLLRDGNIGSIPVFLGGNSGSVSIAANEVVEIEGSATIATIALVGSGDAGTIEIVTDQLRMRGGNINTSNVTGDVGKAGSIRLSMTSGEIIAGSAPDARPAIESRTGGAGPGGSIAIEADTLSLVGEFDTLIDSQSFAPGDGGDITIQADQLTVDGVRIAAETFGPGRAGDIRLELGGATLTNGAQISATSRGEGTGGSLTVNATGDIGITGRFDARFRSGLFSNSNAAGDGGSVKVDTAGDIWVDEGRILTRTLGAGNAGTLNVQARNLTLTNGAQMFSGIGDLVEQGGAVEGFEDGRGVGGDVTVRVEETLSISGRDSENFASGIFSNAQIGLGRAGNATVSARNINITDDGTISSLSTGNSRGDAGDIIVSASDSLALDGGSITAEARSADGGNISVRVGSLVDVLDSEITATVAGGAGDGGNIDIDPTFVVLDNGQVIANAFGGAGGNIRIVAEQFIATPDSVVQASSELGIDGEVVIDAPATDLSAGVSNLPSDFLDAASLLSARCGARHAKSVGSFTVLGHGFIPPDPAEMVLFPYRASYVDQQKPPPSGPATRQPSFAAAAKMNPFQLAECS